MLEASGPLSPNERAEVMAMLGDHLRQQGQGGHRWALAEEGGCVLGAAFWAPERMTDRTWNLYMLAVASDQQGRGLGAQIVAHAEERCRADGARLLLVETLGSPEFAPQRAFYANRYDKVIFRKLL